MSHPGDISERKRERHARMHRRRLLRLIAGSPLLAAGAWPGPGAARPELAVPSTASEALDVFQLRDVARARLDAPTWHFIANGADDGRTMRENRAAFDRWRIRARRLVDVSRVDMSLTLLGEKLDNPIILAPVGGQQSVAPGGELATARAAGTRGHLMICSTVTSYPVGEIASVAGGPLWFQLYASPDGALMRHLSNAAEQAACRVLVLTVDSPTRGNREAERWFSRLRGRRAMRLGNFEDYAGPPRIGNPALTWEIIPWLRAETGMKIVLKGIVTREDAALCSRYGVDGIIVSNHGGRQEESGRATLDCLPEVLAGAGQGMPVMIDGGFRRGTDIFKALALGATAVAIGRPYLWGLGAFGEDGVRRVLSLLRAELKRIMQFAGTTELSEISDRHVLGPGRRGAPGFRG